MVDACPKLGPGTSHFSCRFMNNLFFLSQVAEQTIYFPLFDEQFFSQK